MTLLERLRAVNPSLCFLTLTSPSLRRLLPLNTSEFPADTLDLLLLYKAVLFSVVIPLCVTVNTFISPLHHLFLFASSHSFTLFSLFFCELLSEMGTFIITRGYVSWKPFLGEGLVPVDEC